MPPLDPPRHSDRYVFLISLIATFGGFLFGYDLSLIGAANSYIRDQFHLNQVVLGFTTASAALGCMVGPFLGGWLCDRFGRERTMMVAAALLAIGALLTALAPNVILFNVFRIVGGIGVGLCSIASPMYVAEVAPARVRGQFGIVYQLSIVVGSTMSPLIAYFIVRHFPEAIAWRWMFGSQMVFVVLFGSLLFFLPPSPRWLAARGRINEASRVLVRIHGPAAAEDEIREIKLSIDEEPGGFSELLRPGVRLALGVGLLLAFFNNWTGWSAMGAYIPIILQTAGVHSRASAILQFAISYLAMAALAVIAMLLVDRLGRRPLWIFGSIAMAVFTAHMGFLFSFHTHGIVILVAIILCTLPQGLALGPLPWLMMSEIFPNRIRAKAVSVTTTFLWMVIFSCGFLFPILTAWSQRLIGSIGGVFWIFTGICIISTLFGIKILPETKGQSLEAIGRALSEKTMRRKSSVV